MDEQNIYKKEYAIKRAKLWAIVSLVSIGLLIGGLSYSYFEVNKSSRLLRAEKEKVDSTSQKVLEQANLIKLKNDSLKEYEDLLFNMISQIEPKAISPEMREQLEEISNETGSLYLSKEGWFTVIASISLDRLSLAQEKKLDALKQLEAIGYQETVHIYQTTIGNNYAVTLGKSVSKDKALELRQLAVDNDIAKDAFSQKDRGWRLVE
ncbi:MAG: hypothetical protein AAF655_12810 [Bacteroidota bacterium]